MGEGLGVRVRGRAHLGDVAHEALGDEDDAEVLTRTRALEHLGRGRGRIRIRGRA